MRSRGVISWDWNVWPALLDLHLSRGLFCTMEFKRSRSPTIFVPSPCRLYGPDGRVTDLNRQSIACRQLDFALVARSGSKVATMASSCTVTRFASIALDN